MCVEQTFRKAAKEKQCCILTDRFGNERLIEPYGIFINPNGIKSYCVYQTEGYSESGDLPEWRNLPVGDCADIQVTEEFFEIHSNYNPANKTLYPKWIFHI